MFNMIFDFEDRELNNIDYVNAALSAMQLSDVSLEDSDGFVAVTTHYDTETHQPKEKTYDFGFDKLDLACEAEEDEDLHIWQIDAHAFPEGEISASNEFHAMWCDEHPDRALRRIVKYSYGTTDVFVVLHHERIS